MNLDLPLTVGCIGMSAMILVFALGALGQQKFETWLNHEQFGLDRVLGSRSRQIKDGLAPDSLPKLPSLNDERAFARPGKCAGKRRNHVDSIAVVEPNLFVPLVAGIARKGLVDRVAHQAVVRDAIELRPQLLGDERLAGAARSRE